MVEEEDPCPEEAAPDRLHPELLPPQLVHPQVLPHREVAGVAKQTLVLGRVLLQAHLHRALVEAVPVVQVFLRLHHLLVDFRQSVAGVAVVLDHQPLSPSLALSLSPTTQNSARIFPGIANSTLVRC